MRRTVILVLLLLANTVGPVAAQPAPQEPPRVSERVVVTTTAAPVPAEAVTRTVTTLGREDLEQLGLVSLIDGLRFAPGVDVRARGPRDVQSDFSIRGATFGQHVVLVDGFRINDSQSGHHNGELPAALFAIDRIEVVSGPGSAVHGADALGGIVNVITRRDRHHLAGATIGQFGYLAAQGSVSGAGLPDQFTAFGWLARSGNFDVPSEVGDRRTTDREFTLGGGALRGAIANGVTIDVRHQRRTFGANGFYGNSPSKEWTDQTLAGVVVDRSAGTWLTQVRALFRNHGDHFRWDIARPGFAENRHRTDAGEAAFTAVREFGGGERLTIGGGGGGDWIESSNLGDHEYGRGYGFAEWQMSLGSRAMAQTGLRFDGYSTFGHAWSPSAGAGFWINPNLRLRVSAARAFRVPTFTELYYRDPSNLGTADLQSENGWSLDGGLDWSRGGWTATASPFIRWDRNVIDWVRPSAADLWRSTNVRDVTARGIEGSVSRRWRAALLRVFYAGLDLDAPSLNLLSKYVLEYARHSSGTSVTMPIASGWRAAVNADFRRRLDGQSYTLVSTRVSRRFGRADLFVDANNLLDEQYREIPGVDMPGRWISFGATIR